MQLTPDIVTLLAGPVMVLIGTDSESGWPSIGRALGARVIDPHRLELVYSGDRYPGIAHGLADQGRAAVTVARVTDYACCQIKGRGVATIADAEDAARAAEYRRRLTGFFEAAGAGAHAIDQWFGGSKLMRVALSVTEVYDQTPGAQAGTAIGRAAWI